MPIIWLSDKNWEFPHPSHAGPEGLLAAGGDLSPKRLVMAYANGIFPWFNADDPILWWSPDPRMVLFPPELVVSKSMNPYFNQQKFGLTCDTSFERVVRHCQAPRTGQQGTWITESMVDAYCKLNQLGIAHSVEVWQGSELVGGLYGIALGKVFYGESMFATVSNASKFGFIALVRRLQQLGFWLVDCQQETAHLARLGARPIPRQDFLKILSQNSHEPTLQGSWAGIFDVAGFSK